MAKCVDGGRCAGGRWVCLQEVSSVERCCMSVENGCLGGMCVLEDASASAQFSMETGDPKGGRGSCVNGVRRVVGRVAFRRK